MGFPDPESFTQVRKGYSWTVAVSPSAILITVPSRMPAAEADVAGEEKGRRDVPPGPVRRGRFSIKFDNPYYLCNRDGNLIGERILGGDGNS